MACCCCKCICFSCCYHVECTLLSISAADIKLDLELQSQDLVFWNPINVPLCVEYYLDAEWLFIICADCLCDFCKICLSSCHSIGAAVYQCHRCTTATSVLQRSLLLSPEQRSELIQLRRLFISKLSSIIDQRKEIYTHLTVSPSRLMCSPITAALTGLSTCSCHAWADSALLVHQSQMLR